MSRLPRLLGLMQRREQARLARCAATLRDAEQARAAAESRQRQMHSLLDDKSAALAEVRRPVELRAVHGIATTLSAYGVRCAEETTATAEQARRARSALGEAHAHVRALGERRVAADRAARAEADARADRAGCPASPRKWHESCE